MNRLLSVVFVFISLEACQQNQRTVISDYQYYPIEVGQFQIYEINESIYSISSQASTRKYYLKERISEKFSTGSDQFMYKIERSKRSSQEQAWKIDSVWTVELLTNKIIRTENNIPYVKLIIPIQTGLIWNKNEYNNFPDQRVSYNDIGKSFKFGDKSYPNTISVVIKNDSSLLSKNKNIEVYALNYGMVYKENTNLAYCQSTPACIGKMQIDYGKEQTIKLIEMGIEK
ncbi:MAG: hypothetical protein ACOVO2_01840 [Emticicia sp.]|uniref:hypothetical protein n=1 Tax=Emticicia sp. TaxID=1930953 RepID=UPI003BA610EE